MKICKFIANLSLICISTLSINAHALDIECIKGTYPSMQHTWGTWTEWTNAEEQYYDRLEMYHSVARWLPTFKSKGDTSTFYTYESFNEPLKIWFVAPDGPGEFWQIWPLALAALDGEVLIPTIESCGPTGDELIVE